MDANPHLTLKSLRGSLLLLLLATLAGGGAVATALFFGRQTDAAYRQAETRLNETRARLARASDDEREIRAKIARYEEIIGKGRTEPERRLEWVETLRGIKTARRLLGLDYEIAPQQLLDEKLPAAGGYTFLVSPMKLDMPLLHEDDLLGLLADLKAQVRALVSVRRCKIDRLPVDPTGASSANLKAACDIDWITLQEKT